eukprot:3454101-Karenia_brevis.AAC.1
MERPYRDLNAIETVNTSARWAPFALTDRPPRPPAPVRASSDPRPPSAPGRAPENRVPDIHDTIQRID